MRGESKSHLDSKRVSVASSQSPHAVVCEAIVQLSPGLGALLLAGLLQCVILAIRAILHRHSTRLRAMFCSGCFPGSVCMMQVLRSISADKVLVL